MIAEYLEVSGDAELWLNGYARKLKAARERLKREIKDETFIVLSIYKNLCQIYANRSIVEVLYGDLQLTPAHPVDELFIKETATPERLDFYEADRIIVNVCQESESLLHWEQLQSSLPWQNLKAVRGNRVYTISSDPLFANTLLPHTSVSWTKCLCC
jgi:ABC-type Fe3+-hydroxamate transport system substrate-binding protein